MTRNLNVKDAFLCLAILCCSSFYSIAQTTMERACFPTVENFKDTRIKALQFGRASYSTTGSRGVNVWSEIMIPFEAGKDHPVIFKPNYLQSEKKVYWKVWIDFNQDGDFLDLHEYVAFGEGTGNIGGSINIPSEVWNGKTYMRVAISTDGFPGAPCDPIATGEVEDHLVIISDAIEQTPKDIVRGGLYVYTPNRVGKRTTIKTKKNATVPFDNSNIKNSLSVTMPTQTREIKHQEVLKLKLAPNPSLIESQVYLTADGESVDIQQIIVTSMNGEIMTRIEKSKANDTIDKLNTADWPSGIYNVTAVMADGRSKTEKLVVIK